MSLNRTEQQLFDHILGHADERQHWEMKVRELLRAKAPAGGGQIAPAVLAEELWRYHLERLGTHASYRQTAGREGTQRTSMRNLAEHLLRVWGPARPSRTTGHDPGPEAGQTSPAP